MNMAAKCEEKNAAALRRKSSACVLELSMGMKLKHQTLYLYAV